MLRISGPQKGSNIHEIKDDEMARTINAWEDEKCIQNFG
jgi:hypothetical protein